MHGTEIVKLSLALALVFLVCFAPLSSLSGEAEAWSGMDEGDKERVEQGQVVIVNNVTGKERERRIQTAFLIHQPIDRCWELFQLPERQYEFTSRLDHSTLVSEDPNRKIVHFGVNVLFLKIQYQVEHIFHHETYRIDTRLDPEYENDLKELEGIWRLYQIDEHTTLVRHSSVLRISSAIPRSLQNYLAKKEIPSTLEEWRLWIESDGTWRKAE